MHRIRKYLLVLCVAAVFGLTVLAQDRDAKEPALDKLFEDAFAAVAGVKDPSSRLFSAYWLSEADVKHGGGRLETRLIALLEPARKEIPAKQQPGAMAYQASTLAVYGRTPEMLAVMRKLDDSWNYGAKVLRILVKNGDVATAVVLAERERDPADRLKALKHIVQALAKNKKSREALRIFKKLESIYDSFSEIARDVYTGDYLGAMAYVDFRRAEGWSVFLNKSEVTRSMFNHLLTKAVANRDPSHALELALKIKDENYRGFALSIVIRATARNPKSQKIYQRALAEVDPLGRAYAYRSAARYALNNGEIARAREAVDQLDAMVPQLSKKDRARVADRAAVSLAIELLSGDVNQVFEKMAGLGYGDGLTKSIAVSVIANTLRNNGHFDLGRRVAETIPGTTNHASYFIAAINARFE